MVSIGSDYENTKPVPLQYNSEHRGASTTLRQRRSVKRVARSDTNVFLDLMFQF